MGRKVKSQYSLIFFLLFITAPVTASNHIANVTSLTPECIAHLLELAGLVKQYNQIAEKVISEKAVLQELLHKGDSLTAEETQRKITVENSLKNLEQQQVVQLLALNSKSDRVIRHCD